MKTSIKPIEDFVGKIARVVDWKYYFSKASNNLYMKLSLRFDDENKFTISCLADHIPYMYVFREDKRRFLKQIGREGRSLILKAKPIKKENFIGYKVFVKQPPDVATLKSFFAMCKDCNKPKHVSIESKRAYCNCGSTEHRLVDIYFPESDVVYEKRWAVDRGVRSFVVLVSIKPYRVKALEYDPNDYKKLLNKL